MKILVIEDQWGIIQFLKQGLTEEGYEIHYAQNAIEAYKKISEHTFALILLDWMLPQTTGIEVCKHIRSTDKKTPILFLTAKDTLQDTIEGLSAGANDYIKKPFHFEELLMRIKVQLRTKQEVEERVEIKIYTLVPSQNKFYKDGIEINLTQKEYLFLAFLIKNKGVVCSRKQILAEVWHINFEYDTAVLDVFMNAIRKKLKLDKSDNFIQTIRGVGFLINP